jgi:hypothetical protein
MHVDMDDEDKAVGEISKVIAKQVYEFMKKQDSLEDGVKGP